MLARRRTQVTVLRSMPWWRQDREASEDMYSATVRMQDWVVVVLMVVLQAVVVGLVGLVSPFLESGEFDAAEAALDRSISGGQHTSTTLGLLIIVCGFSTVFFTVLFRDSWKPYALAAIDGTAPSAYAPLHWCSCYGRGSWWTHLKVGHGTGRKHVDSGAVTGAPAEEDMLAKQLEVQLTQQQASDTVARAITGTASARAKAFSRRYGASDLAHD